MPVEMILPLVEWSPVSGPGGEVIQSRLHVELESWVGTPYLIGQQCKGVGVDCVRFVGAILDFMGRTKTALEMLPADACFHDSKRATASMHAFRTLFRPMDIVDDWRVQPGDVVIVGPVNGGPGHGIIVGCKPGVMYEAGSRQVQRIGTAIPSCRRVFGIFRKGDRATAWTS